MNEILRIRTQLGMTQKKFAVAVGVGATCITNYETGYRSPKTDVAKTIVLFARKGGIPTSLDAIYGISEAA